MELAILYLRRVDESQPLLAGGCCEVVSVVCHFWVMWLLPSLGFVVFSDYIIFLSFGAKWVGCGTLSVGPDGGEKSTDKISEHLTNCKRRSR